MFSLSLGRAGRSRLPPGVHCASTTSPKIAWRASFTAKVPALLSPRSFGYCLIITLAGFSWSLLMADEGNALLTFLTGIGFGLEAEGLDMDVLGGDWGGCCGCCIRGLSDGRG